MKRTFFGFTFIWLDTNWSVGETIRIGWNLYTIVMRIGHWYLISEINSDVSLTAS